MASKRASLNASTASPSDVARGAVRSDQLGPTRLPIERVEHLTAEQFETDYVRRNRPVIMTGRMKDWPALREWTPKYFKENHGDVVVRVSRDLPDTAVPYSLRWADHKATMTMAEFVEFMNSADRPCYVDERGLRFFPGEERKVEFGTLIADPGGRALSLLWIGSKGTRSGLHFDRYDNLFGQVLGEKVVCLLAPAQSRYLYQFRDVIQKSNIDPEKVDVDRYPKVRQATIWEGVVRPGDILFIPKLWWHWLRSTEVSVSVNHWFGKDAALRDLLPAARTSGVLSWLTIARDFVWHGMLKRPFQGRLMCEEPNGVWLFGLAVEAIRARVGRWQGKERS